jgi:hypothetical protein
MGGMLTLQDERIRVLADPAGRTIYVSTPEDPLKVFDPLLRGLLISNAEALEWSRRPDGDHYRLRFPEGSQYQAVEMVFDGQGWLRQLEMQWGHVIPLDPDVKMSAMVRPRVVMEMQRPGHFSGTVEMDPSTMVIGTKGNLRATGQWKDYEVFDTRVQ